MASLARPEIPTSDTLSDEAVVTRVLHGEPALFEILMRRYNQRLYRVARSILRDDAQAEDVMQTAYVHAYEHLAQFAGRSSFAAWLTRIAANEALGRVRDRRHFDLHPPEDNSMDRFVSSAPTPEQAASSAEIRHLLDTAIESLPDGTRTVFVLRDVEGLTTTETSGTLGISEENVKVRLHRARRSLRKHLLVQLRGQASQAFAFHASRCDRVVAAVFAKLHHQHTATPTTPGGKP